MTPPLRLCVGDIGSNAIKTRIVEVADGVCRTLSETRYPVRLGASVFESQAISPEALEATVSAFQEVAALCRGFGVDRVRIVATSATRDASNQAELLEAVRRETGLSIEIISGREEGRLLALAARPDLKPGYPNLVLDVGGGSTEVISTRSDLQIRAVRSLRLGAVRLASLAGYTGREPLGKKGYALLREKVESALERSSLPVIPRETNAVGAAGTMGALLSAKFAGQTEADNSFTLSELREMLVAMRDLDAEEIAGRFGLDRRRAEVILPGGLIVAGLMEFYSLDRITVTRRGLRDALLAEMISGGGEVPLNDTESAVLQLGEKYEFDRPHAEQVARLAAALFDQLAPVHVLPAEYRDLLRYAALLHDIGQFVAYRRHHRHSGYLIRHGELPGLTPRQKHLTAAIARFHRKALPGPAHLEFALLSGEEQRAVTLCAAMLRLADALDCQHRRLVDSLEVAATEAALRIAVRSHGSILLELSAACRKAGWLGRVFGLQVSVYGCEDAIEQGTGETGKGGDAQVPKTETAGAGPPSGEEEDSRPA